MKTGRPVADVLREKHLEDDAVARSFYETVLSGKLRQAVHQATYREGG